MTKNDIFRYFKILILSTLIVVFSDSIDSTFLRPFLSQSLLILLVALFAITTAIRTALLSKLKEFGDTYNACFTRTASAMKFSLYEQMTIILCAFVFSLLLGSKNIASIYWINMSLTSGLGICFFSSLQIIFDTALAVMLLLEEQQNPGQ